MGRRRRSGALAGFSWTPAFYSASAATFSQTEKRTFEKVGGAADWDSIVYSTGQITGNQLIEFIFPDAAKQAMIGLADGAAPAAPGYAQMDYGIYLGGGAFENTGGALDFTGNGALGPTVKWGLRYFGTSISIERNTVATGRGWTVAPGLTFRVQAIFNDTAGCIVRDLRYMPL